MTTLSLKSNNLPFVIWKSFLQLFTWWRKYDGEKKDNIFLQIFQNIFFLLKKKKIPAILIHRKKMDIITRRKQQFLHLSHLNDYIYLKQKVYFLILQTMSFWTPHNEEDSYLKKKKKKVKQSPSNFAPSVEIVMVKYFS